MYTAYIHQLNTEDARAEDPAATRDRLKDRFPKGATRRMTQLGMLLGAVLDPVKPGEKDTLIYASEYAESRALEGYLDSFPNASPTLFQTSIHPSAVQQLMILKQQPVRVFFPVTGRSHLIAQALQVAAVADTDRTVVCGGEERGTWLLDNGVASDRSFAYAFALSKEASGAAAKLTLVRRPGAGGRLSSAEFFDALALRLPLALAPAAGWWLTLEWS
jgi:hypothetical protein